METNNRLYYKSKIGKLSKEKALFFLAIFVYKVVIELVYLYRISPLFSYSLLTTDVNIYKMLFSWVLCILLCYMIPTNEQKPSTYLYLFMTIIIWIPLISYYWMNNQSTVYVSCEMLCAIIVSIWCRIKKRSFFIRRTTPRNLMDILFALYVLLSAYLIIQRGGIDPRALDFRNVYLIRGEYEDLGTVNGYLVNWCAKAFFPAMSSYMFLKKRKIAVTVSFVLQIGLYMAYGVKAFLASIVFLCLIYYLISRQYTLKSIVSVFSISNVAAYLLDIAGITDALRAFLPYRTLFIPAKNQFHYYEYFLTHDYLNLSGTFFGRLFSTYAYDKPIGFVVEAYFINSGSNGNTGVFSYGFADFGFWGMVAVAFLVGFLFWFIDCTTYNVPIAFTVGALSYWVITMNDNSLLITMITGGFIFLIVLLMLINNSDLFKKAANAEGQ